jgi:hypothetical protein
MKRSARVLIVLSVWLFLCGFQLDNAIVPRDEILSGGPPKDGIPAILEPEFLEAHEADFLKPDDGVIGVALQGEAKAYAVRILTWHEVVNDELAGEPIAVTF